MMRLARIGILLAISILFGASTAGAAKWTFMVYMAADNNLEAAGIKDFLEMAAVGSSDDINILVQMDRIPGYSDAYGDWTDCKRFRVAQGMTPIPDAAEEHLGEVNTGDPAVLIDFINWGTAKYPADRYALILWDHGSGWQKRTFSRDLAFKAICSDDSDGHAILYNREVRQALQTADVPVNLIGFDACLMAMVEVAYEIRDAGPSVMVASEELEPGDGWPYDAILGQLAANPGWSAAQLGYAIVELYYASYSESTPMRTQSVIDLTKIQSLADAISGFADTLRSSWETDPTAVRTSARSVMDRIDLAVIHEKHGDNHRGANGLAIYFPLDDYDYSAGYNGNTIRFPADNQWDEFLDDYYTDMSGSWIESARKASVEFQKDHGGGHIDLYHFCSLLASQTRTDPGYTVRRTTYGFEDISATGTRLSIGDEGHGHIQPGFDFSFYGDDYDGFGISDNGAIYFEDANYGNTAYTNEPVPGSTRWGERFIAVYWDDLDPAAGGDIFYEVRGSGAERRLIVQWTDVFHYGGGASGATFQALLYENGRVLLQYADTTFGAGEVDNGNSATIGLQGSYARGLEYAYNTPDIPAGTALLFIPETTTTCTYALSADARSFSSAGGKGSVAVSAGDACAWSAAKDVGWISIEAGSGGTGDGTVSYTVLSNPEIVSRSGRITIGDGNESVAHTITQASVCRYTVSPEETAVSAAGGAGDIQIETSGAACGWTAAAGKSWITITHGDSGSGNGEIGYSVAANPGATTRQGTIQAAGKTVILTQAGTATVKPVLLNSGEDVRDLVQDKNGSLYFKIDVPEGASDLQVHTAGGSGDCDLSVRYGEIPTDDAADSASVTVGNDETVIIDSPQAGSWFIRLFAAQYFSDVSVVATYQLTPCSYGLSEETIHFTADGGTDSVAVEAARPDCAWSTANPHSWIKINSSNSGVGNGRIDFTVSPNLQPDDRQGTLTIVNQTLTIVQNGAGAAGSTELTNGISVNLPDEEANNARYFTIDAPADQTRLTITMRGEGDADLYVRYGEEPTLDHYDYAPYLAGSNEEVHIDAPKAGIWHIMIYSFEGFSNVSLTARYDQAAPTALTSGEPLAGLVGDEGSLTYFKITVPDGMASLVVETTMDNAAADPDLYIRYGQLPSTYDYDASSTFAGGNEIAYIATPQAGDWFILVYGYSDYSDIDIQATYSACGYELTLSPEVFGAEGGDGEITIDAANDACTWEIKGGSPWIAFDPTASSGVGDGSVAFTVTPNDEATTRNGVIIVANQQVDVAQFARGVTDAALLTNGHPQTGLDGAEDNQSYFRITVPEGQRRLSVTTWSGAGDCDIFLRREALPTMGRFDGASMLPGNEERIVMDNPESGDWYVLIYGYAAYEDANLVASHTECDAGVSPAGELFTSDGGAGAATVSQSAADCEWTAFSTVPWITINAGDAGTGEGTIDYAVSSKSDAGIRSGAIHVMGAAIEIDQLGVDFPSPVVMENGMKYTYEPSSAGAMAYLTTTVAEGERLRVESFGGAASGDCDLYARHNQLPTTEVFDVRSQAPTTEEIIDIDAPAAGAWHILVHFPEVSDGVAVAILGAALQQLSNGIPATNLAGSADQWPVLAIDVPAGRETLTITTESGVGMSHLYVRQGRFPDVFDDTKSSFDYDAPLDETIDIESPREGTWYAMLVGNEDFEGVSMTAAYSGGDPLADLGGVIAILQTLCAISPTAQEPPDLLPDTQIDIRDALVGLRRIAGTQTTGRTTRITASPSKIRTKPMPETKIQWQHP